ncbi:hypothetical protein MSAN_01704600 [Mycena sanguinolenta]|uniref:F-box domain-containing protein n=1 Tax=Mycena sanguinolenta TaxID=230812 RepID=A0A8H6Y0L5_9AGAR|nr:hypothetical protein MSAN_01704600 [Mycena sanguinolenta]
MPPVGILDLPTEILVKVFDWVEDESLYHLALLSRRLNFIALSIYFSRQKVDLESKSEVVCTLGGLERDVLSALQICLFIKSLERIDFSIPHSALEPTITPFLRHTKRLETFISRLTSVRKVSLRLAPHEGNWSISLKNGDELRMWSSHVGTLLNWIVRRGCQYLSITDGSSIETDRPGLMDRIVRRIVPTPPNNIPAMPPFPSGPSQLTTLVMNSATLLTSPGIDWVQAALRQAPITSLALQMSRGNAQTWSDVLPRFAAAAPRLTLLVLTDLPPFIDVVVLAILDQFSNLTDLHMSYQRRLPDLTAWDLPRLPSPQLRRISSLRAPSVLAEHLLTSKEALPELRALCVLWRARPRMNLPSLFNSLATIAVQVSAHSLVPRLSVDIDARAGFTAADVFMSGDFMGREAIAAGCARVERLTLRLEGTSFEVHSVARLVAFFPETAQFSLATRRVPISEWMTTRLQQTVKPTRRLREIEINGKAHSLRA